MSTDAPGPPLEPAGDFVGPGGWREGLRYGALALPLAFVALPLYVLLPSLYAREFGVPLGVLGAVLLGTRAFDALLDPWIGRLCDRLFARSAHTVLGAAGAATVVLALGLWGLLLPPALLRPHLPALLLWAGTLLALTCAAYSIASVAHQAWGARLGGTESQRSRVQAWREGLALLGVLMAAVRPALAGLAVTVAVFATLLALGWLLWTRAAAPWPQHTTTSARPAARPPWHQPRFVRLLAVFMVNGIASAIPATLVLFFVQDRLRAPPALEPAFLATYFLSAALSLPLWVRLVPRLGLARCWGLGMLLAVAVFVWTLTLGEGDASAFLWVCALSGAALGTDLALPSALLAGLVGELEGRGRAEGAYLGWWNGAAKLNLALAAGLALPLLGVFGYVPGTRETEALLALSLAYAALPCALKLLAAGLLYRLVIRPGPARGLPAGFQGKVLP